MRRISILITQKRTTLRVVVRDSEPISGISGTEGFYREFTLQANNLLGPEDLEAILRQVYEDVTYR